MYFQTIGLKPHRSFRGICQPWARPLDLRGRGPSICGRRWLGFLRGPRGTQFVQFAQDFPPLPRALPHGVITRILVEAEQVVAQFRRDAGEVLVLEFVEEPGVGLITITILS